VGRSKSYYSVHMLTYSNVQFHTDAMNRSRTLLQVTRLFVPSANNFYLSYEANCCEYVSVHKIDN
jgi:hypothetical protein